MPVIFFLGLTLVNKDLGRGLSMFASGLLVADQSNEGQVNLSIMAAGESLV